MYGKMGVVSDQKERKITVQMARVLAYLHTLVVRPFYSSLLDRLAFKW